MAAGKVAAVFMRGGTSKALMFHARDLPADRKAWDPIFLAAMGSPDPSGRQLDGMGGGNSSLSKVCIIAPAARPDADVDYTFGQVSIDQSKVDYSGNCGNMSSAVGPFAVDEGIVPAPDGTATVRIYNTNTGKIIHSRFPVERGRAVTTGDLAIPGVTGTGAPVQLDFLDPGGASTGKLLPTGAVRDCLDVPGVGAVECSMIDAANGCVFVPASALGLSGNEMPAEIERSADLLTRLAAIRVAASVAMGIASDERAARAKTSVPFVGFVSPSQRAQTLAGEALAEDAMDVTVRMLSSGQPHRALPLTASLCVAVAAALPGSVVHAVARQGGVDHLRLATPSGILGVAAKVVNEGGSWRAVSGSFLRTARRLFDGHVYY